MPETPEWTGDTADRGEQAKTGNETRKVTALALVLVVIGVGIYLLVQPRAGATSSSGSGTAVAGLAFVTCRPLASDPPLEPPQYAMDDGARGGADSWWCQLPHATQLPVGFGPVSRYVAPLPNEYADYSTQYAKGGSAGASDSTSAPSIIVTSDVNSSVTPGGTVHKAPPGDKKVTLINGITADVSVNGSSVAVSWSYPTTAVPSYLQGVSNITVQGTGLPMATVMAVARHVEPD
jgi:hypothetical protein